MIGEPLRPRSAQLSRCHTARWLNVAVAGFCLAFHNIEIYPLALECEYRAACYTGITGIPFKLQREISQRLSPELKFYQSKVRLELNDERCSIIYAHLREA